MKLIESLKIKEKVYIEKLENGLTIMLIPKTTTNKIKRQENLDAIKKSNN